MSSHIVVVYVRNAYIRIFMIFSIFYFYYDIIRPKNNEQHALIGIIHGTI